MKIFIIGYMHPKYDKRVFRTVKALSKDNEVIYQYWTDKEEIESKEGNIFYKPIKYEKNVKANPILKLMRRRKLDKKIVEMIKNYDYDIVYFHHFLASRPLAPFKVAKKRDKVVIYDIHEYHPENFLNTLKGFAKVLKEKVMWKIFERQLKMSDKLVFVSKETKSDIFEKLKINKPYLIIPNYASISVESKEKKKEISFVGKVTRNLSNEKKIIKRLIEKGFKFKIIGMDSDVFKDVPHEYTTFLPYEDMMEQLSKSAFSLISYNTVMDESYKNDIFALPHKYYDSIAAETPVIVKNTFVSMAKEVEKYGIGVVIDPNNVDKSVEKILKAYENYENLLENIKKYKDRFVWNEKKEKEFISFVLD